jgi:hypothetical protein
MYVILIVDLSRSICSALGVFDNTDYVDLECFTIYESVRVKPTLLRLHHHTLQGKIAKMADIADDPGSELAVLYLRDDASIYPEPRILYIERQGLMFTTLPLWDNSSND